MYEVLLTESASRVYERAGPVLQRRVNRCIGILAHDPRDHPNSQPLTGVLSGRWRFRIGDWRVVYRIDDEARQVIVLRIAHRREVYR